MQKKVEAWSTEGTAKPNRGLTPAVELQQLKSSTKVLSSR